MKKLILSCSKAIESSYRSSVTFFLWCLLFVFTFFSFFSSTALSHIEETYFLADSVLKNILVIVVFTALICFIRKKKITEHIEELLADDMVYKKAEFILLSILFAIAVIWVLATQKIPADDPIMLQHSVENLQLGNFRRFEKGGYFDIYPHQLGIVVICYIFSFLFGSENFVAFQLFNAFFLLLFYKELCDVCARAGIKRSIRLVVILMGIFFLPLIMYCSLVYGTLGGMSLSMTAVRFEIDFFRKQKKRYGIVSALLIFMALMLKKNSLIYLIGMCIYAVVMICRSGKLRPVGLLAVYIMAIVLSANLPITAVRNITGMPLDEGSSSWCWIAMGMQDSYRAPGWFNGYVESAYKDNGCTTAASEAVAKKDIKDRIGYFAGHKREAVEFYTKKTVSQWTNPSFEAFWIQHVTDTHIRLSDFIYKLISIKGEMRCAVFLKAYMMIVYFTALFGTLMLMGSDNIEIFICPMIFIGGALFHIFIWEAEAQYTIPYYPLIFPTALLGADMLADKLNGIFENKSLSQRVFIKRDRGFYFYSVLSILICVMLVILYSGDNGAYLTADSEEYRIYLDYYDDSLPLLPKDGFNLSPYGYSSRGLSVIEGENGRFIGLSDSPSVFYSNYSQGKTRIFVQTEKYNDYMTVPYRPADDNDYVVLHQIIHDYPYQQWVIREAPDGGVYIVYGSRALTYDDEGNVLLAKYTGDENQMWLFTTVSGN